MSTISYVDQIFSLADHTSRTGLSEVKKYLQQKGNPHEKLRIFHVTGTNGKGSVCQMLSQVLAKQFGHRVGLFLSPHLVHVQERIQINGQLISDEDFNSYVGSVYEEIQGYYDFSPFVIIFLASIFYFLDQGVEYVVYEVGLGGTEDATNVWPQPLATFITSVSLDHQSWLGFSLEEIQENKMGIMKSGVVCYTPVVNEQMREGARRYNASLRLLGNGTVEQRTSGVYSNTIDAPTKIPTSLLGDHQETNAALVYHYLVEHGYDAQKVQTGLQEITHEGRCQWLTPSLLVDGAHNSEGVAAFVRYVDTVRHRYSRLITVFGTVKKAEELELFSDHLLQGAQNYLIQPKGARGLAPRSYRDKLHFASIIYEAPMLVWLEKELPRWANQPDTLVVIYGSLYLIGEVLAWRDNQKITG